MTAPFKAECPHCFTTFNLKSRASVGKKVKCKSCGEPFTVKLVGAAANEFEDDIEDYGDVEDYGAMPAAALPASRSSKAKPAAKKKKRKGGSSFPMKPIVIGLVVIAVGVGGWFGFQALPGGNPFAIFDSPEGLLDKFIATQYDMMDTMASVNSPDDMEWLKGKVDGYGERIKNINKRLLLLGPISEERAKELKKYSAELRELHQEQLRDRGKAEIERLRNADLINEEFQEAVSGLIGTSFSLEYIMPTPEPREKFPIESYLAEQDELSRDTAKVLIQVDDLSSAKSQMNRIKELTARYQALQQHEHLASAPPGSPYFSRRLSWGGFVHSLQREAGEFAQQDPEVEKVYDELSTAINDLGFAEHNQHFRNRPGGPGGGPPEFDPSRPGVRPGGRPPTRTGQGNTSSSAAGPSKDKLKQMGLAMHNYHEVHKAFPGLDRDAQGHIGLSWRVHLLPFLEQAPLHRQFDLDAEWSSTENLRLQTKRPDILKSRFDNSPVLSSFHVFEGEKTPFGELEQPRLRDLRDGSSNTILIIEAQSVTVGPWTKPGGIQFSASNPKQGMNSLNRGAHEVLMFDGSVRSIPPNIDDQVLSRMIQHDDGKPLR